MSAAAKRIRVAMHGAAGRMGRAVTAEIVRSSDAVLTEAIGHEHSSAIGKDAGALAGVDAQGVSVVPHAAVSLDKVDVIIDFSSPAGTRALLELVGGAKKPLVICTTGLWADQLEEIGVYAKTAPVVVAANTSVGVTVLASLVAQAAKILNDFDAEIVEMHHRNKVDAPSGTALRLARAIADARDVDLADVERTGRSGQVGPRTAGEIGIFAMRGGDVIGDHTVVLAGNGERIELTHKATSRTLFAQGALRAARWVVSQKPGLYRMEHVLGLSPASA